jgi:hypothetical protein
MVILGQWYIKMGAAYSLLLRKNLYIYIYIYIYIKNQRDATWQYVYY